MTRFLLLCIGLVVSYAFIIPAALSLMGYQWARSGHTVGERAAAEANVSLCNRVISYLPFSPPTSMARVACVRRYAELTKDPSACELLMPSSYGLYCVGGAQTTHKNCGFVEGEVRSQDGSMSYADCRFDDPKRTVSQNQCCLLARVTFVVSENDCSSLSSHQSFFDECLSHLAFKNRDPESCANIQDANLKSACTVQAKAMRENPSICSGCKQPVSRLEDLK